MATATSLDTIQRPDPRTPTIADLVARYGEVLAHRIVLNPTPGMATVDDVVAPPRPRESTLRAGSTGFWWRRRWFYESNLACVLIQLLRNFLDQHRLGVVAGMDGMMTLAPGLVRLPDVSFISREQFPDGRVGREAAPVLCPTLAGSKYGARATPRPRWIGSWSTTSPRARRLVWYLDPADRAVRVYTSPGEFTRLDESETLDGGEVLPGFLFRSPSGYAWPSDRSIEAIATRAKADLSSKPGGPPCRVVRASARPTIARKCWWASPRLEHLRDDPRTR